MINANTNNKKGEKMNEKKYKMILSEDEHSLIEYLLVNSLIEKGKSPIKHKRLTASDYDLDHLEIKDLKNLYKKIKI